MKIVITGGCGFIGSNVADALFSDKHHVTVVDNLSRNGVYKNLIWLMANKRKFSFAQADVRDDYRMRELLGDADAIFHFAAQTAVTTSVDDPRIDFDINALGTFNVLEAARLSKKNPLVVFASTNKVYGDIEANSPISETQPLSFCTPYGCSKGTGDQYVRDYAKVFGIPTVVLRMSCVYGDRQFGTEDQGWLAHFAFNCYQKKPITIYGDGTQIRDILYVDDYVQLCRLLLINKDKVAGEVFNVGGGPANAISVGTALKDIQNWLGETEISYSDWRPADQKYYVSDINKVKELIGWEPKIGIKRGLEYLSLWVQGQKKI